MDTNRPIEVQKKANWEHNQKFINSVGKRNIKMMEIEIQNEKRRKKESERMLKECAYA